MANEYIPSQHKLPEDSFSSETEAENIPCQKIHCRGIEAFPTGETTPTVPLQDC